MMATPRRPVSLEPGDEAVLTVVVDTEEEFEWGAPFDRAATSVTAMDEIHRFQEVCDSFGIRPTYVVDHPVATQPRGYEPLRAFARAGRAEIGAHLHPWVSPPFEEALSPANSYPGNLPRALEHAKLRNLVTAIESSFGERPRVYKAGRYGFGPNTAGILRELAFEVDMSFCPAFDLRDDGGPDYSRVAAEPFWFGDGETPLLEVPNTGAFVGFLKRLAAPLHRLATRAPLAPLHLPGILSRLRAVDRLMLSPEGYTLEELRRLTLALFDAGLRVFTFSLHSPTLKPGCTPYVRSPEERTEFLDRCGGYFDFFFRTLGGTTLSVTALRDRLVARAASVAA